MSSRLIHQRGTEWVASFVILAMGIISLLYPQTFARNALSEFAPYAIEWTWLCLGVGIGRIIALLINGHWNGGTPSLRLLGSLIGAAMFGALVGNLLTASDVSTVGPSWGVGTYGILMLSEIRNAFRSATDLANVKKYGG